MGIAIRGAVLDERTRDIAAVYWNRVEPRPRSREFADILAARIRESVLTNRAVLAISAEARIKASSVRSGTGGLAR